MARCVGEGDTILVEIVVVGELAAKGVAAAGDIDLVDLVVACLEENGQVELGARDEFENGDLVAEVRQANDEAVEGIALGAEMFRIEAGVLARLHGAVLSRLGRRMLNSTPRLSGCAVSWRRDPSAGAPLKNSRLPMTSPSLTGRRFRLVIVSI